MNKRIEKLFENVCVNEQIKQLAEQAGCTIDRLGYGEGNLEKFAELIVAKCIKILVTSPGNENTSDAIWDLEKLGVDVSKILENVTELNCE